MKDYNEFENNAMSGEGPVENTPDFEPEENTYREPVCEVPSSCGSESACNGSGLENESPAGESCEQNQVKEQNNGEYSYSREEIPYHSYIDANYQCGNDIKTPRSYYTPPKRVEKKPRKKGGMGRFIAACLVCAVLGGVGGGALVASQIPDSTPSANSGGLLNVNNSDPIASPAPSTIATGEKLTGAEIYALGCEQSVGVATEITYRNYFGYESSTAVSGSGFIVTENGYIVTNYHVIQTAYEGGYDVYVMLYSGERHKAEIVGFEKDNDIAILKIDVTGLPAATLGSSNNLRVGDDIYAIGNPLGELNFSMTSGNVSALDRQITTTDQNTGKGTTNNMFQIDAAVNEGNSGGPVYNDRGEVVGIVTAKYAETGVEGLGFALPIDDVIAMIEDIVEFGYVTGKPSFGITAQTVSDVSASYYNVVVGAEVKSVNEGSCAEKAGMQVGDIITALNGKKITGSNELIEAKKDYKPGDTVTVTVYRGGEYLELAVVFDEETGIVTGNSSDMETQETTQPEREKLPTIPKNKDDTKS